MTSVAVAITMPAAPTLPPPIHNQACLVIGGVYVGSVRAGHEGHAAAARAGYAARRHLAADADSPVVQTAFDGFFPMGKLQSYWKAQNLAHAARRGTRDHRGRANQRRRR